MYYFIISISKLNIQHLDFAVKGLIRWFVERILLHVQKVPFDRDVKLKKRAL